MNPHKSPRRQRVLVQATLKGECGEMSVRSARALAGRQRAPATLHAQISTRVLQEIEDRKFRAHS